MGIGLQIRNLCRRRGRRQTSGDLLRQHLTKGSVSDETISSRKHSLAVTFVLFCTTNLGMGLPIGLHCVIFRALFALPLLLAVFPAKVLLYSSEITESSRRMVVDARRLRTDIYLFFHLFGRPLPEFPWKIVTSPVKLQILVSLKPFVANFTHKSICGQKGFRRQNNYLCIRIWHSG